MIRWYSRKQNCVATSLAEAEYVALPDFAKELTFINPLNSRVRYVLIKSRQKIQISVRRVNRV